VLNSTTNVVLTEIEKGANVADAVQRAQALGIGQETDSDGGSGRLGPRR